jgi:hypothetical protein
MCFERELVQTKKKPSQLSLAYFAFTYGESSNEHMFGRSSLSQHMQLQTENYTLHSARQVVDTENVQAGDAGCHSPAKSAAVSPAAFQCRSIYGSFVRSLLKASD